MEKPVVRHSEFVCPFVDGAYQCPEWMSPVRETPSRTERKLFILMNRPSAPTRIACTRCGLFMSLWKKKTGIRGHLRYLRLWLTRRDIRDDQPIQP